MKIAIASGKGGTGKTTVSSNLAKFLAEKIQVVLIDLDVEEPNSSLFIHGKLKHSEDKFKMIPEWIEDRCNTCGICQNVCSFNAILQLGNMINVLPELCHSCHACSKLCSTDALPMIPKKMGQLKEFHDDNLTFIESKLEIGEEQAVPLIKQTKKYVKDIVTNNTIQIFDSPPGTSCPVIEAVKDVDYVILVTEPTPFGYHDLKLAVETMEELDKEFGVVINRDGIGNNDVEEFCHREGIGILAKIPNSREIAELYSQGKLLYDSMPEMKEQLEKIENFILKFELSEAE